MYDLLPFPQITSQDPREQVKELTDYLYRLREDLEFILMDISIENLSPELVEKLNSLGADIEMQREDHEDQLQQVSNQTITISDVINSPAFNMAVESKMPTFTINFATGELEYQ